MRKSLAMMVGVVLLAALFGALVPAWGQEVSAAIVGTVVDPSGAPIKGAAVVARDTERGTVWKAETNDSGDFNILRLPVGTYTAEATAPGFEKSVYPAFTLVLNQSARLEFKMKMGKISETVEVTAAAPIMQTQSVEVSTVIDANTNVSLPLASRNYLQLTLLAPGVTNVDPDGMRSPQTMLNSGRPYINGNREQANEYLIDGILNSEDKNNETGYTPGIDAIQEFNLITQNASAEFGNYQGGVVSVSTKSGTNYFSRRAFMSSSAATTSMPTWLPRDGPRAWMTASLDTTRMVSPTNLNSATTNSAAPSAVRSLRTSCSSSPTIRASVR